MDRYGLLSNTCYGNWLPGDSREFIARRGGSVRSIRADRPFVDVVPVDGLGSNHEELT